jgi:hypothetical protein
VPRVRRVADLPGPRNGRHDLQPTGGGFAVRQIPQGPRGQWAGLCRSGPALCGSIRRHEPSQRSKARRCRCPRRSRRRGWDHPHPNGDRICHLDPAVTSAIIGPRTIDPWTPTSLPTESTCLATCLIALTRSFPAESRSTSPTTCGTSGRRRSVRHSTAGRRPPGIPQSTGARIEWWLVRTAFIR